MAEPVRARRLTDQEGRRLLQIVRRGKHGSVRVRRAMIIMASASGTLVPAIARLVAAGEDTVRDVIHAFNAKGLAALDPRWAGGRPRRISDEDIEVIVAAATTRPEKPGQPFTRWSLRKLADYLACRPGGPVTIGRERLRQILHERGISFQRTRTWTESTDPDRHAKLDRIEHVTSAYPGRCFASGQFGPPGPAGTGCPSSWTTWRRTRPRRSAAGPGGKTPGCASRRRTRRGLIRSRRTSVRCGPLSWAPPTIRTTRRWPAGCRPACAGATPTPATPTCWPPSAANDPHPH